MPFSPDTDCKPKFLPSKGFHSSNWHSIGLVSREPEERSGGRLWAESISPFQLKCELRQIWNVSSGRSCSVSWTAQRVALVELSLRTRHRKASDKRVADSLVTIESGGQNLKNRRTGRLWCILLSGSVYCSREACQPRSTVAEAGSITVYTILRQN